MHKLSARNPEAAKWYLILFVAFFCGLTIWIAGFSELPVTLATEPRRIDRDGQTKEDSTATAKLVKVTGFSSHECHTTWCNAHAGEPRGQRVAVHKKFGRVARVYIPTFDKTYDVIGTTDLNTEIDIWFGDEYANALDFGAKQLLVHFLE